MPRTGVVAVAGITVEKSRMSKVVAAAVVAMESSAQGRKLHFC